MKRRLLTALLLLALAFSLAACGAGAMDANTSESYSKPAETSRPADTSAPAAPSAAPDSYKSESASGGLGMNDSAASDTASPAVNQEKLIYTVYAEMETQDFDATIAGIQDMIARFGGFLESSSVNGNNYYTLYNGGQSSRSAHFVIRVPAERLEEMKTTLATLGNVPFMDTTTENITTQYYDASGRLTSLRIQEERLLAMLELAETVEDMLTIESHLADVRYEIESLTTKLDHWDSAVSYSTVTLNVSEVATYTEDVPVTRTYWQQAGDRFVNALEGIGDFFSGLLLVLISCLPALVLIAVLVLLLVLVIRRGMKRGAAKRVPPQPPVPPAPPAAPEDREQQK